MVLPRRRRPGDKETRVETKTDIARVPAPALRVRASAWLVVGERPSSQRRAERHRRRDYPRRSILRPRAALVASGGRRSATSPARYAHPVVGRAHFGLGFLASGQRLNIPLPA